MDFSQEEGTGWECPHANTPEPSTVQQCQLEGTPSPRTGDKATPERFPTHPSHPILWKTHHTAPNPAPRAKGRTPTAALVLIFQGISWPIPNSRVVGRSAAPHCHLLSLPLPQHPKFRVERVPAGAELLTTRAGPRAAALQRGLDFLINERRTPRDERVPWGHLSCSITPCSAAMGENTQEGFWGEEGQGGVSEPSLSRAQQSPRGEVNLSPEEGDEK